MSIAFAQITSKAAERAQAAGTAAGEAAGRAAREAADAAAKGAADMAALDAEAAAKAAEEEAARLQAVEDSKNQPLEAPPLTTAQIMEHVQVPPVCLALIHRYCVSFIATVSLNSCYCVLQLSLCHQYDAINTMPSIQSGPYSPFCLSLTVSSIVSQLCSTGGRSCVEVMSCLLLQVRVNEIVNEHMGDKFAADKLAQKAALALREVATHL